MTRISEFERMTGGEVDAAISDPDYGDMNYRDIIEFCPAVTSEHLEKIWALVSARTDTHYNTVKYPILNHGLVSTRILIEAVSEPEWVLRSAASRNSKLPLKYVMHLLGDSDPGVRENAKKGLGFHIDSLLLKFLK